MLSRPFSNDQRKRSVNKTKVFDALYPLVFSRSISGRDQSRSLLAVEMVDYFR